MDEVFRYTQGGQNIGTVPWDEVESRRIQFNRVVQLVSSIRSSVPNQMNYTGRWLDVGCGSGILLALASEVGYTAIGIDARPETVTHLTNLGYRVYLGDINEIESLAMPVDVLSMADVLEHMPFPRATLMRIRNFIVPGGLLYISLPSRDSILWKLMGFGSNPYWYELEHFHNFSTDSLKALLVECGFKPVYVGVSERYIMCQEIVAVRLPDAQ